MNDRARAIALLKQARDLLSAQLTEQVLENAEGVLDDARGDSFQGEIEGLYDRFGARLSHVNQMLQHLPPLVDEAAEFVPPAPPSAAMHLPLGLPAPKSGTQGANSDELPLALGGLLGDVPSATLIHDVTSPPVTFAGFLAQARAGDVPAAAQSLAWLCDLDAERALDSARVFCEHLAGDAQYGERLTRLASAVAGNQLNDSLVLLFECFGLLGVESLEVLQTLRLRLDH